MNATQRRQAIARLVVSQGSAAVNELATAFEVSAETVRTDLLALQTDDRVTRTHGGAIRPHPLRRPERPDSDAAVRERADRIAGRACDLLTATDATLLLDAGPVAEEIARRLAGRRALTVVTRSVRVAERLAGAARVELVVLPGLVCRHTQAAAGPLTTAMLSRWRVDVAFIEARAPAPGTEVWTRCDCEVPTKRAAAAAGHQVVYLDAPSRPTHPWVRLATLDGTEQVLP